MVRGAFLKLNIKGAENLPAYPNNPAVIVANHASNYDIYLLEILMQGYPHVWLSKESYLKIPLFGFLIKRFGVPVDRENAFKAGKALVRAYNLVVGNARHLVLFPEGTRFDDGKIHNFHSGFAVLAKKLGRPVVPIFVSGLDKFLPKRNWLVSPEFRNITIIVGKPVFCGQDESSDLFSARIQDWFCKNLKSF